MVLSRTPLFNDANLVSYWPFEGNSTDIKSGNNGTDTTITYGNVNGKYAQGAGFNGTSSYIAIADHASLRITGALSIVGWVFPSDTTPNKEMVLFAKGDQGSAANLDYTLTLQARKIRAIVSNGVVTNDLGNGSVMTNLVYHHVAMVYVPSTSLTLYLDGVQDTQSTTSIIAAIQSTTHACAIGRDGTSASNFLGTKLDDEAIFTRALTPTEIKMLARPPAGGSFLNNFL